jgi:hypothetical protein
MRKTEETFVRQNSEDTTKKLKDGGIGLEVEIDLHQNIVDEVNNWISESRENRRAEKAFSDERILAWRVMSLSSNPR